MQPAPSTWKLFKHLNKDDLQPLVKYISKASTESLTSSSAYKKHCPDHTKYISEIYDEICLFGGNTFANLYRGKGPKYSEVLEDVAAKLGVKNTASLSVLELEQNMIEVLLRKAIKEASESEKEEIESMLYSAGLKERDYRSFLSGSALAVLVSAAVYRVVMQQTSAVIANAIAKQLIGHGVRATGSVLLGRLGAVLLGPVTLVITGVWTVVDIAGPAFRVTIPCTLHIAMLRQQFICNQEVSEMNGAFDD